MNEQNDQIEDLKKEPVNVKPDNQAEEKAVSKTAIYENMSRDIQQALQKDNQGANMSMMSFQNNPPVKSPWSNQSKKAYIDAIILAFITSIFGLLFLISIVVFSK